MRKLLVMFADDTPKGRAACFGDRGEFLGTVPLNSERLLMYGTVKAVCRHADYDALSVVAGREGFKIQTA